MGYFEVRSSTAQNTKVLRPVMPQLSPRPNLHTATHLVYRRAKRFLANRIDRQSYAHHQELQDLPYTVFTHQSPLIRPFPGVSRGLMACKAKNLQRVAHALDGLCLNPGDAFSFWRQVGPPTLARGYVPALSLSEGKIHQQIGGGICQASNLIFWMIAHSPLTILERWRHDYDIFADVGRTQPFGSGASLAFNHHDLRFINQTAHTYQLRLWLTPTHLHGSLNCDAPMPNCIKVEERDHQIRDHGGGHFSRHNKLWRIQGDSPMLLVENNAVLLYEPLI